MQWIEGQRGRGQVKSPKAGELTGNSWIKLHLLIYGRPNMEFQLQKNNVFIL
jgi:hypothetical protein